MGSDVIDATSPLQQCAGQDLGCEAAVHYKKLAVAIVLTVAAGCRGIGRCLELGVLIIIIHKHCAL